MLIPPFCPCHTNRIGRLARQGMALHVELLSGFTPNEPLVTDGFESFVSDQYQPNNIHLLTGKYARIMPTMCARRGVLAIKKRYASGRLTKHTVK